MAVLRSMNSSSQSDSHQKGWKTPFSLQDFRNLHGHLYVKVVLLLYLLTKYMHSFNKSRKKNLTNREGSMTESLI